MSSRSAYSQLCRKHQQVVDAFVKCGIQSDAYTEAYGPTKRPDSAASRLFAKALVQQAVRERTEQAIARAGVRQVRVLEELAAIAFLDAGDLFNDDNSLRPIKDLDPKIRSGVMAVETDELFDGVGKDREKIGITRKLKLQPKIEALKLLGQHLKLFTGASDCGITPPPSADPSNLSDLDKARRVGFLLWQGMRALQEACSSDPVSGNPAGSPPAPSNKQEINS